MTTGKFISQLEASIKKLESLVQSLQCSSFHPSKTQYEALADLGLRLTAAADNLPVQVTALQRRRAEPSSKQGSKLLAEAQPEIRDLISTGQLKDRIIFGRNIIYFFDGQRDSVIDSEATKTRKQLTRERCERICTLSPDGLIFWAAAFMPTIWTSNLMSKDTFDYVFENIEPDDYQVWPPDIYNILSGLGAEEPLQGSQKYHEFLKVAESDKRKTQSTGQPRKRRRVSDGAASEGKPLCLVQTSELVARTPVGQYASKGSTSPNKATEAPANNQVAAYDKAGPSQAPTKETTNTNLTTDNDKTEPSQALGKIKKGGGDAFIIDIEDARYALSLVEHVWEVWLTNPEHKYKAHGKKRSFLTLWISEAMGEELGKRGKPMVVKLNEGQGGGNDQQ